jgi:excisionase family DNA binding protein
MDDSSKMITLAQAAKLVGVSRGTPYYWVNQGVLTTELVGKKRMTTVGEVRRVAEQFAGVNEERLKKALPDTPDNLIRSVPVKQSEEALEAAGIDIDNTSVGFQMGLTDDVKSQILFRITCERVPGQELPRFVVEVVEPGSE